MSLCPSSSHQLVAAAIAFRRARRKFPKDFGLESTAERAYENIKETATCLEGPINQAKSSSTLVRRACNSRSDHVCPANVRNRDYDPFCGKENSNNCNCCRTRNIGEDISELQDECSGGDTIDVVPSREYGEFASSGVDRRNGFTKPIDRDRYDLASRSIENGEAIRLIERIPQSAHPVSYHHCKKRCPCSNVEHVNNSSCDSASREMHDKVACGDFTEDRSREFTSASCHGTSIDLDGSAEENVVIKDARSHSSDVRNAWTRANISTTHRKIVNPTWRCECHPCEGSISNLSRSSCDRCRDGCCHRRDYHRDCSHRHCCCHQRDRPCINVKRYETHGSDVSGEKAQHKSWRDQMRGENSRLYGQQCYLKEYSGIIPASRARNDEECREKNDNSEDEDDDSGVAVINHKDSMCILAEKYRANRKWRSKRYDDKERLDDRISMDKDECNKSSTSEIVDQPESPLKFVNLIPHGRSSVKHVCRVAHCENCGLAKTCSRGCEQRRPENSID